MLARDIIEDWIEEQSPVIQSLARRFPPGSRIIDVTATEFFVLGYFEDGALAITDLHPAQDVFASMRRSWTVNKESVAKFRPIGNG